MRLRGSPLGRNFGSHSRLNHTQDSGDVLHCVHLPRSSPKSTCHMSARTVKQQSPQDNSETTFKLVL